MTYLSAIIIYIFEHEYNILWACKIYISYTNIFYAILKRYISAGNPQ